MCASGSAVPMKESPSNDRVLCLCGLCFIWITSIEPESNPNGTPVEFTPHQRYARADSKHLHAYGQGPFCRFKLTGLPAEPGIYALTVDDEVVYVGKARVSMAERWGARQYGNISPANCYIGGQSTNCKINSQILLAKKEGMRVELWFHRLQNPDELEKELIGKIEPRWNDESIES